MRLHPAARLPLAQRGYTNSSCRRALESQRAHRMTQLALRRRCRFWRVFHPPFDANTYANTYASVNIDFNIHISYLHLYRHHQRACRSAPRNPANFSWKIGAPGERDVDFPMISILPVRTRAVHQTAINLRRELPTTPKAVDHSMAGPPRPANLRSQ